jgi:hypothetical protein
MEVIEVLEVFEDFGASTSPTTKKVQSVAWRTLALFATTPSRLYAVTKTASAPTFSDRASDSRDRSTKELRGTLRVVVLKQEPSRLRAKFLHTDMADLSSTRLTMIFRPLVTSCCDSQPRVFLGDSPSAAQIVSLRSPAYRFLIPPCLCECEQFAETAMHIRSHAGSTSGCC